MPERQEVRMLYLCGVQGVEIKVQLVFGVHRLDLQVPLRVVARRDGVEQVVRRVAAAQEGRKFDTFQSVMHVGSVSTRCKPSRHLYRGRQLVPTLYRCPDVSNQRQMKQDAGCGPL